MDVNLFNLDKEMSKRTLKQYCSAWNELRYDEMCNKPYFIGKRSKDSEVEILCPINSNKILTYSQLKANIIDSGSSSVNLAIYSNDSSVVVYKAHLGLKPPIPLKAKENDSPSPGPSKKRKIDNGVDSISSTCLDQNKTHSDADYFQIDLYPSVNLEASVTDNSNSG